MKLMQATQGSSLRSAMCELGLKGGEEASNGELQEKACQTFYQVQSPKGTKRDRIKWQWERVVVWHGVKDRLCGHVLSCESLNFYANSNGISQITVQAIFEQTPL